MSYTIEGLIAMLPGAFQASNVKVADTAIQLEVTGTQAGKWNAVIKDGKLNVAKAPMLHLN